MEENKEVNIENQEKRAKQIKKDIKKWYNLLQKNKVPSLSCDYLEKIIELYNELYSIQKPSLSDKTGFSMLKIQYKTLCAISRRKPNRNILK